MSKELDALEKVDHTICLNSGSIKWGFDTYDHIDCESFEKFVECYDIIEKGLSRLEEQDKVLEDYNLNPSDFRKACLLYAQWKGEKWNYDIISKKLKALDIILPYVSACKYNHMDSFYLTIGDEVKEISEETFDLFKSIF